MAKRKVFVKTDLNIPQVEHVRDSSGVVLIPREVIPPKVTEVAFGYVRTGATRFNFDRWYGVGIDTITYACQRQIERFLDKQDAELSILTIRQHCVKGAASVLKYLSMLSIALQRELTLNDINRQVIDGYLGFLRDIGNATTSQKNNYQSSKAILWALGHRGLIQVVLAGDEMTFPRNPFPKSHKTVRGAKPLSRAERQAFSLAIKKAVMPIFSVDVEVTSHLLAYALLAIALHTGRNTWPLLEMSPDCLRSHPKDDILFLVLYKRRGHSTSKVALRADMARDLGVESLLTLRLSVARLVRRVIELSEPLRKEAPIHLRNQVWLFRVRTNTRAGGRIGEVSAVTVETLRVAVVALVKKYRLVDAAGNPLQINVSRLRKTFINRVYEILEGDVAATAAAAGDTIKVVENSYLIPGDDSMKNWKFMGNSLVHEMLSNTIGATERTPVGRCTDNKKGEYAPKRDGAACMNFFNCLRCRNYVVTGEDLYRLFSFYWRIIKEQGRINRKQWQRRYQHIVRLIDRDVIEVGLAKGVFNQLEVAHERERARCDPHPFWRRDTIITEIVEMTGRTT